MITSNLYEEAPEWMIKPEKRMDKNCLLVKRIEDLGEIKQMLTRIHRHELFEDISKHSTKWSSKDPEADELLDETRRKICGLQYMLEEMSEVLERDYSDS